MLSGVIASAEDIDLNAIFKVSGRVGFHYGRSIDEMLYKNQASVENNTPLTAVSFIDSTGTIPAMSEGDPVGLFLDQSKSLQRLTEMVASTNLSGFTVLGSATKTTTSFTTVSADTGVVYSGLIVGKWYELVLNYDNTTTDELSINNYDTNTFAIKQLRIGSGKTIFKSLYNGIYLKHSSAGTTTGVSVSIKEIPGFHLVQEDPDKRATISYRYNLIDSSEDFTEGWVNTGVIIEDDYEAPDGSMTAFKLKNTLSEESKIEQALPLDCVNGQYVRSIYLKAGSTTYPAIVVFEGIGGSLGNEYFTFNVKSKVFAAQTNLLDDYGYTELNNGWVYLWFKITKSDEKIISPNIHIGFYGPTATQNEVLVWHPDMRLNIDYNDNIPKYQATHEDGTVDKIGFPAYLKTNGNSSYHTDITLSNATKAMVAAGMYSMDDNKSIFIEYGTDISNDEGVFNIEARSIIDESSRAITFKSKGDEIKYITHYFTHDAPNKSSFIAYTDLVEPILEFTIAKIEKPALHSTQGSGVFMSRPLYLFGRSGETLLGNYRIYTMPMVIFMPTADNGLTSFERSVISSAIHSELKY